VIPSVKRDYEKEHSRHTSAASARCPPTQASSIFKSAVLNQLHLNKTTQYDAYNHNVHDEHQISAPCVEQQRAFYHDRQKNGKKNRGRKNEKKDCQYWYDRSGQTHKQQPSAYKESDLQAKGLDHENSIQGSSEVHAESKAKHKQAKKGSTHRPDTKADAKTENALLLPCSHTNDGPTSVKARKRLPRLNGADLYVARLGKGQHTLQSRKGSTSTTTPTCCGDAPDNECPDVDSMSSSTSTLRSIGSASSGSLHEELLDPLPKASVKDPPSTVDKYEACEISASRPCYRCVTYMHSVGIRRVFWTNGAGRWEGGKVRDLIDSLDQYAESSFGGVGGGPIGDGLFVTKHEVLMLRRLMGDGA